MPPISFQGTRTQIITKPSTIQQDIASLKYALDTTKDHSQTSKRIDVPIGIESADPKNKNKGVLVEFQENPDTFIIREMTYPNPNTGNNTMVEARTEIHKDYSPQDYLENTPSEVQAQRGPFLKLFTDLKAQVMSIVNSN